MARPELNSYIVNRQLSSVSLTSQDPDGRTSPSIICNPNFKVNKTTLYANINPRNFNILKSTANMLRASKEIKPNEYQEVIKGIGKISSFKSSDMVIVSFDYNPNSRDAQYFNNAAKIIKTVKNPTIEDHTWVCLFSKSDYKRLNSEFDLITFNGDSFGTLGMFKLSPGVMG